MAETQIQRIRQVAAAIRRMDTESAEQLLAHFPADIVTKIIGELKGPSESAPDHSRSIETVERPAKPSPSVRQSPNESSIRRTIDSDPISQLDIPYASHDKQMDDEDFGWLDAYSSEQLAASLKDESKLMVAAILRSLPLSAGTRIVQALPTQFARSCLDQGVHLQSINSEAIRILIAQWKVELSKRIDRERHELHDGDKIRQLLQAIPDPQLRNSPVENIPSEHLQLPTNLPGNQSAEGAQKLEESIGLSPISSSSTKNTQSRIHSDPKSDSLPLDPKRSKAASQATDYPAGSRSTSPQTRRTGSDGFVIPIARKTSRSELLKEFLQLDDLDLLSVLYRHEPDKVLAFLAGAGKSLRQRIEQLTAPKLISKLRRELAAYPQQSEDSWRKIADEIAGSIREIQSQKIGQENAQSRVSA